MPQRPYDFSLDEGSLAIDFYVEVDGKRQDYRVIVTREEKPDTSLKSLIIKETVIEFDPDKLEYEFDVEYSVNELHIEAVADAKDAKVEIEEKALVVGENEIKITVTNGKNKTNYILKVTREENIDKSVANLKFSEIPEKLNIKAVSKDADSTISISGNEKLKNGSKIIVKNKLNESKITREYSLIIQESHGMSDNKTVILISIIVLSMVILILVIIEIHSRNSAKKKYIKKIFDLRHKIEKKRKEEKEKKPKEEKDKKLKIRIKPKKEEKKIDDDGIEII